MMMLNNKNNLENFVHVFHKHLMSLYCMSCCLLETCSYRYFLFHGDSYEDAIAVT